MANSQAMCSSFKRELLNGEHQFGSPTLVSRTSLTAPTADVFKLALFLASASRGAADTVYNTTGELAGTGNYTQGGKTLTMIAPALDGTTAHTTPNATQTWTALTSSGAFDAAVLFNSTQSNKQVSVHTFSSQNVTAADFSLTMPTNNGTTGLVRIA
jgi:hypothetical protein